MARIRLALRCARQYFVTSACSGEFTEVDWHVACGIEIAAHPGGYQFLAIGERL